MRQDAGGIDGLPSTEELKRAGDYIRALERGLAVIKSFSHAEPRLTLAEVAEKAGLNRASARRFLLTLHCLGYISYEDGKFSLTPQVMELGYAYMASLDLPSLARPAMVALSAEVGEPVSLFVFEGNDAVIIGRAAGPQVAALSLRVGSRLPAYATAAGNILLGHIDQDQLDDYLANAPREKLTARTVVDAEKLRRIVLESRKRGWAIDDQGLETGGRGLAVPLHDKNGEVVAALNVGAPVSRVTIAELRTTILQKIQATARQIEQNIALASSTLPPVSRNAD